MPDGEIFTSPVETETEGEIRFSFPAIFQGRGVEDVRLRFEGGRVVHAEAGNGNEFLQSLLDMDEGARILGEAAFGLNYEIDRFTRDILFDEKIGGTMHFALGSSFKKLGGRNESGLHWDMICDLRADGEVYADGELVWKAGQFLREPSAVASRAGRSFLTRVAVISDTHLPRGTRALPDECVRLIAGADLVLHAGDFVSAQVPRGAARSSGRRVVGVCGKHGRAGAEAGAAEAARRRGRRRCGSAWFTTPGPRERREARLAARFEDCGAVVYGHTHVPQVERFQHLWVLNPGSPTERRSAPAHSMIVLSVKGTRITPELLSTLRNASCP